MKLRTLILAATGLAPLAAPAMELDFPGLATQAAEEIAPLSSYTLPVAPWRDGNLETLTAEGAVVQQAWQIQTDGLTTLQILRPLRGQLAEEGFEPLFECEDDTCGGFDFRYAADVLPEPDMHVNLGDFRYLAARKTGAGAPEYVSLLVSRSSTRGYVQVVHVGPAAEIAAPGQTASTKTPDAAAAPEGTPKLADRLETKGRAVLGDLRFATGSAELAATEFASLEALAAYLRDNPARRVVLVGHTDSEGALAGNIALSKRRAQAVADYLVGSLDADRSQIGAEGVGYLSPLASNLTVDGREKNRRVEVILTSTQ
ncbi:OmpA family protein [Actibacterium sp. MT2.3-13A]|uniref:OmpA family protein n=1 Tax=Actibacterium sp. MT2.3-13A TaxID=2828332 RepID=UPI001BABE11C|nr:OmpA family protein [Actibacterium sp. MT2.3-13A]